MSANVHGGDLDFAVRQYGLKREEIKDFSGNINPFGIPESAKRAVINNIDKVSTYPDKNYLSLRTAIAEHVKASVQNVVVGNGSTELISLFVKTVCPKKALVVAPVYSEYEREIKLNGGSCEYYALKEENGFRADIDNLRSQIHAHIDMLAICNPNNPTGTAITRTEMEMLLRECSQKGVNVLIDETYCEFADESVYSSIPLVEMFDNAVVVRGVSKFFAAPGLRLGYAVCGEKLMNGILKLKDPWSVNILAAIAAEEFFSNGEYISKTKQHIEKERKRIKDELSAFRSIRAYETVTNFQLFRLLGGETTSEDLFEWLIVHGMMVRDAKSFKFLDDTFIRFCFLREDDNNKLLNELRKILR